MWLMHISDFMRLDKLRPHQELREAGAIITWDYSMDTVLFLSHRALPPCPGALLSPHRHPAHSCPH